MKDSKHRSVNIKTTLFFCMAAITTVTITNTAAAGPLNLSDNALEIVTNIEPNIMILNDDSGSMDWSVMTNEGQGGTFHQPFDLTTPKLNPSRCREYQIAMDRSAHRF